MTPFAQFLDRVPLRTPSAEQATRLALQNIQRDYQTVTDLNRLLTPSDKSYLAYRWRRANNAHSMAVVFLQMFWTWLCMAVAALFAGVFAFLALAVDGLPQEAVTRQTQELGVIILFITLVGSIWAAVGAMSSVRPKRMAEFTDDVHAVVMRKTRDVSEGLLHGPVEF